MSYRILITGSDSFIGTSCEKYLAKWPEKYIVDTVDMTDLNWRKRSFEGYDVVFHVAGIAHQDAGRLTEAEQQIYKKVNCDLAVETAQKAKKDGVGQFIYMSSMIVYGVSAGIGREKIITSKTEPAPANFYGYSKLEAEKKIAPLESDGFKVVFMRPPMIYGPGCRGNYPRMSSFAGKRSFFPKIKNCRSMLYIDNFAEFLRLVIENRESGVFFPQNSEYTTTSEMVKLIASIRGKKMILIPGLGWLLKLASHFSATLNKVFGNLCYDMELSCYRENYRICSFEESVRITEEALEKQEFDERNQK